MALRSPIKTLMISEFFFFKFIPERVMSLVIPSAANFFSNTWNAYARVWKPELEFEK